MAVAASHPMTLARVPSVMLHRVLKMVEAPNALCYKYQYLYVVLS